MNTVRIRLALAFILIALVTATVTTTAILGTTHSHFDSYRNGHSDLRIGEVQQFLASYYAARGSWDGVASVLSPSQEGMVSGVQQMMGTDAAGSAMAGMTALLELGATHIRLISPLGRTIAETSPEIDNSGGVVQSPPYPVTVGGKTVGILVVNRPLEPPMTPLDQKYSSSVTSSALLGGLAAVLLAGLVGALLARRMAGPVNALAATARQFADRNLRARVHITGRDEFAALGDQFNRMAKQLEGQDHLRRSMVADVADELRTPVAVLRGQFEALQDGVIEPTPEALLPLHREVLRLGQLLDDLQALTLSDAAQFPLRRQPASIGALALAAASAFEPAALEKGVRMEQAIAPGLPTLNVDAGRIRQVLLILLGNALRHTPIGRTINLDVRPLRDFVQFAVADAGAGIAPDDLPHVFDRFFRGEQSRSGAGGGSGIGLAIARRIVEAHGGTISAESQLGQGTRIRFTIPVGRG